MNLAEATQLEPTSHSPRRSGNPSITRFYSYLKPIAPLLADPEIEEVMSNGPGEVFFERRGEMFRLEDTSLSPDCLRGAINVASSIARITVGLGKGAVPLISAHLDNLRIAAAISPVALHGDSLCIRRHRKVKRDLAAYVDDGSFHHLLKRWERPDTQFDGTGGDRGIAGYFQRLMEQGASVLVSGTPSGGKSTFLDMLVGLLPTRKRVVVIEDTHEIEPSVPNRLCLVASEEAGVTIRDLVRFSLRCRPDLLVVGEIRGAEAADFITAANSGPKAIASIHADGPLDALRKLESLALQANEGMPHDALRRQIASSVQVVVHFARVDSRRVPVAAVRVLGYERGHYQVQDIFAR
jgi:pilus assembly protein CpaF